jgi:hypothetical protein
LRARSYDTSAFANDGYRKIGADRHRGIRRLP